jgi:hypothetical protein
MQDKDLTVSSNFHAGQFRISEYLRKTHSVYFQVVVLILEQARGVL